MYWMFQYRSQMNEKYEKLLNEHKRLSEKLRELSNVLRLEVLKNSNIIGILNSDLFHNTSQEAQQQGFLSTDL